MSRAGRKALFGLALVQNDASSEPRLMVTAASWIED
jgi:hypothetical protein